MGNRRFEGDDRNPGRAASPSGATLDRLNDALSALESRIASNPQSSRNRPVVAREADPLTDVNSIRAREMALREKADKDRMAREAEMERMRQHDDDLRAVRDELRAMRQAPAPATPGFDDLRADIDVLKREVVQLARQDSLSDLSERWGVVEREIAAMPAALASRDDVAQMLGRLDHLYASVQELPGTDATLAVEERINHLTAAMQDLATNSGGIHAEVMAALDDRMVNLDAMVSQLAENAGQQDRDALDRIEARVTALTRQFEDMSSAPPQDFTPFFNDMASRIDDLKAADNGDPAVHEALTLIAERVAELQQPAAVPSDVNDGLSSIAQRLDHMVTLMNDQETAAPAPDQSHLLRDLEQRLDGIAEHLTKSTEMTGRSVEQAVASLEARMAGLADMIDERAQAPSPSPAPIVQQAPAPSFDHLEERLDDIARFLAEQSAIEKNAAPVAVDTGSLEAQIADLSARLAETNDSLLNAPRAFEAAQAAAIPAQAPEYDVMEAARLAAEEAVARLGANMAAPGGSDVNPAELQRLSDDLQSLQELARQSEGRTESTFDAIHETLLKIVDHLSDLEASVKSAPMQSTPPAFDAGDFAQPQHDPVPTDDQFAPPPPAFGRLDEPIEPFESQEPDLPPSVEPADFDAEPRMPVDQVPPIDEPDPMPKPGDLTPAQAAASAALAALANDPQAEQADDAGKQEKKSLLQSMTQRFSRGDAAEPAKADAVPGDDLYDDTPLEPGAAQTEVAEIIARVRREREGVTGVDPANPNQPKGNNASKSDFIAAARRAAQAAAADVQRGETTGKKQKSSLKSGVSSLLSGNKRRPILIGAAAILLALLALPFARGYLGAGDGGGVAQIDPAPVVMEEMSTDLADPLQPTTDAPIDGSVANLDVPTIEDGTDAIADLGADVMIDDLASSAAAPVTTANLTLDDIPSSAGPVALRQAALEGDMRAMFLVGDYFATLASGTPNENTAAAQGEALMWYEQAAEAGYAPAQQRAGSYYENGLGADRDLQAAKSWYQLAAEQGNAAAMHNLGVLYANGVDGEPDLIEAVAWFKKAANFGVRDSQYNLGVMAARGDGMERNLSESYKWFALASQSGDTDAEQKRETVAGQLEAGLLQTAKDAVALFKSKPLDQSANIISVPEAWQTDELQTAAANPTAQTADPAGADPLPPAEMQKAVRNIQAILNNSGYDAGPVDGVMGNKTRAAIRAFQAANSMPVTGDVNEQLVRKLLEIAG